MKGFVAQVNLGFATIEGLLLENNEYAVTAQQANELLSFDASQVNVTRTLKALLGKGLELVKVKADRTKQGNAENALTLSQFCKLVRVLDRKGNATACSWLDAGFLEVAERRFDTAFNKRVEEDERNARLKARYEASKAFHPDYTSWLLKDAGGDRDSVQWGKEVNHLKACLALPLVCVEQYDEHQNRKLYKGETSYNAYRIAGLSHKEALELLKRI